MLAGIQQQIVAAHARAHARQRPDCRCGSGVCQMKDYRNHVTAQLSVRSRCGFHDFVAARAVPWKLGSIGDRIVGRHPNWMDKETMRRRTQRAGAALHECHGQAGHGDPGDHCHPDPPFVRSCKNGDRHLEMWVGKECGGTSCRCGRQIRREHQSVARAEPRRRRPDGRHGVAGLHR